jgi:hypothetical protein
LTRATDLQVGWVRLNKRVSWRALQPNEGDPIQWQLLADFEDELRALKAAGITPIVIVDDHPLWATVDEVGNDGLPSHCAAIRSDKLQAFAFFVRSLVARYKAPEFDVHYWELGNEPDVDPILVPSTSVFGCWGDIQDPFYGGERYGEMLKVVVPQIRAEDPKAKVLLGGLLLDRPETTDPNKGRPELFLQGILTAGGGPYFDILAYHAYPSYVDLKYDHDLNAGPWTSWGGNVLGKAAYLRQTAAAFGVTKPLFLDETGLMCSEYYDWCNPPDARFYDMQASHLVRTFVRGIGGDIMGFVWYTLDGPGWRYTGLLDADQNPKPVYIAYDQLTHQLYYARYLGLADYGPGLEAYAFQRGDQRVHVVWAVEDQPLTISVPQSRFIAAYDRDGNPISPTPVGSDYQVGVGFEPVYLIRNP